jgi:hypothetical protein
MALGFDKSVPEHYRDLRAYAREFSCKARQEATMSNGAAAAAAAAMAEMLRREEEEMTPYSDKDLQQGWEFKILRANTAAFKDAQTLKQACDEEAQAGWILVEKFDDRRLRFKRPADSKNNDSYLAFDAYRTQYGMSGGAFTGIIIGITLGASLLLVVAALLIARMFAR